MSLSEYCGEKSSLMEILANTTHETTMAMENKATMMRRVETSRKLMVGLAVRLAVSLMTDEGFLSTCEHHKRVSPPSLLQAQHDTM
jgi:hypothetical protein